MPFRCFLFYGKPVKNYGFQTELIIKFQFPLLSERGGQSNKYPLCTCFKHILQHKTGLNRFTETDLISKNDSSRLQSLNSCAKGIDLVWIQFYVGIKKKMKRRSLKFHLLVSAELLK